MKKLFLLLAVIITFAISAAAQNRTVTGEVLSADNDEPLMGATVMGVGSKIGVVTDLDGKFSINLPASVKKLSVSYVGMTTQEVDITASPMTIKLENLNVLDEVITVAYGTAKRSSFTGSASVLDASQIEAVQVTNPVDALNGRVAGVQLNNVSGAPGSNPTIFIRGISSINAGNEPLIVLDGTPFSGDLNTIATQDIESMTVLKDAASNALYGARGANGVILITTKRGKGNAKVTFDAKWGQNSRAVQDYDVISSPKGYYEAYATSLANSQSAAWGLGSKLEGDALNNYVNKNLLSQLQYNVYGLPEGEQLIVDGYHLNPNATLGNVVEYEGQKFYLTPDNWEDYAYRKSLRQEYSLSVSQATDKGSFYFSANYLNNEGISANSGFERFNGRLSADLQAKPWLKVGANMAFSHYNMSSFDEDGNAASTSNIFAVSSQMPPIYPLFVRDGEGNIMTDANGIQMMDYGDGMNAGLERSVFADANPVQANLLDVNTTKGNAVNGNAFAEVRFLNDFKFTTNNAFSLDETRYNAVTNPFYGMYASSNGQVSVQHIRYIDWTFQQLLNWSKNFGNHNVAALVGHESYQTKTSSLYANSSNMLLPDNTELSGAITSNNNSSSVTRYNTEGWFGRVNYDYDGKYFASASYRRDGSSRFHKDHRWGSFWSFGAAWIISQEKFLQDASWIDMLKLKASYGEQGNDRIGSYRYTSTYTIVNSNGTPAAQPSTLGNPNITWEKGGNFNAGVDFEFWNNRLGGTVEGFLRKTSDMLFSRPLPPSYGYRNYYDNVGDMKNYGVEIDLHGDVYRSKDITVGLTFNMTWLKNKITRLAEPSKQMTCDGIDGYSSGTFYYGEGASLYTFRIPTYAGVDEVTGQATYWKTVTNPDGTKSQVRTTDYSSLNSSTDYHLQGSALPDVYGGFGVNAQIYGFDLNVNFNYQIGGKIYDDTYAMLMGVPTQTSQGAMHKDLLKGWTPENTKADIPRLVNGDLYATSTSTRFLTNAGYLSLQSINVGYTIPTKLTKKFEVDRIRLYFTADNVAIWSKRKGLDPRQGMAQGFTNGVRDQAVTGSSTAAFYSPVRTLSGGINVTF
ncbi:MAG: TonB-dependent receptor [Muribaculaceae bacterium]|nr:TonB-dependent receptor [Muribaculaceae bacterium]